LRPDRSVHVQVITNKDAVRWSATGAPVQLLDGPAIRRARFYRRANPTSPPSSKIVASVEFHADRTVEVTQSWTDWVLTAGRWATTTTNSSGIPSGARLKIEWPQGEPTELSEQQFVLDANQIRAYRIDWQLRGAVPSLARRIVVQYKWLGGAVLTKNDLAYFDRATAGEFRSRGFEFWGIHSHDELHSMSLLVRLPPLFAPKPEDVAVYYKPPGGSGGGIDPIKELTASVQHHALGVFSLQIPYPRLHYCYYLAWPIADDLPSSAAAERFRNAASTNARASKCWPAMRECSTTRYSLARYHSDSMFRALGTARP
jgi:hypothetical protein